MTGARRSRRAAVNDKFPIGEWKGRLLRLTAFLSEPLAQPESIWLQIVQAQPEHDVRRPVLTQAGKFGQGGLQFTCTPQRADWLYGPWIEAESAEGPATDIGALDKAAEDFRGKL